MKFTDPVSSTSGMEQEKREDFKGKQERKIEGRPKLINNKLSNYMNSYNFIQKTTTNVVGGRMIKLQIRG